MAFGPPTVVVASAARTTSSNSAGFGLGHSDASLYVSLALNVTAAAGTTPTLDVSLQWSDDGGATWMTPQPPDSFTQITTAGGVIKQFAVKAPLYRIVWAIAGTTPSFTFDVRAYYTD